MTGSSFVESGDVSPGGFDLPFRESARFEADGPLIICGDDDRLERVDDFLKAAGWINDDGAGTGAREAEFRVSGRETECDGG